MSIPQISLIIPVYNEKGFILPTIESIRNTIRIPYEIICVDDGSTDGGCDDIVTNGYTKLICQPHTGVAAARNTGAAHARSNILVFLDAHCTLAANWFEEVIPALRYGSILTPGISTTDNTATGYGANLTTILFEYKWLGHPGNTEPTYAVPVSGGGCMCVLKEYFDYIGGFDRGMLGFGMEDSEFSVRSWCAGGTVQVVPRTYITHLFKPNDHPLREASWSKYILNIMIASALHHDNETIHRVHEHLRKNQQSYDEAMAILQNSNITERIRNFQKIKRRDLNWLVQRFNLVLDNTLK